MLANVKLARCLVVAAVWLGASAAQAQEAKLVLRVADHFPTAGHPTVDGATRYWMEQVTLQTGRQVEFQYYPAEQLGKSKDMLSLAQSGVADITAPLPSIISDKMPLSLVAELPGSFSSSCAGTAKEDRQADAFIALPKGSCEKIAGGSTTPPAS